MCHEHNIFFLSFFPNTQQKNSLINCSFKNSINTVLSSLFAATIASPYSQDSYQFEVINVSPMCTVHAYALLEFSLYTEQKIFHGCFLMRAVVEYPVANTGLLGSEKRSFVWQLIPSMCCILRKSCNQMIVVHSLWYLVIKRTWLLSAHTSFLY